MGAMTAHGLHCVEFFFFLRATESVWRVFSQGHVIRTAFLEDHMNTWEGWAVVLG